MCVRYIWFFTSRKQMLVGNSLKHILKGVQYIQNNITHKKSIATKSCHKSGKVMYLNISKLQETFNRKYSCILRLLCFKLLCLCYETLTDLMRIISACLSVTEIPSCYQSVSMKWVQSKTKLRLTLLYCLQHNLISTNSLLFYWNINLHIFWWS